MSRKTVPPRADQARASRRSFLKKAAIGTAGAAVAGVPTIHVAQAPVTLKFQSTWTTKDIFHEYAQDFARRVNETSSGRLKIELLPSGAVVKPFDVLDAVAKGKLDGGHGVLVYWYPKNSALGLWGSGPACGMDANMVLAWHYYGGGKQLLEEIYRTINMDVVSFLYGPMPTQPLGWFKKPITKVDDFKGMKYRTAGLAVEIFTGMGAIASPIPSPEVVAAIDRGVLDAAEYNNATSDRALGFPDVAKYCMLQSFHQSAEQFEVLFNRGKYQALPEDLRRIIDNAVQASSADMSWKAIQRYSTDYKEMKEKMGVKFAKTPEAILHKQLQIWDDIVKRKSAENPLFKKVFESQRAFAERACRWQVDTSVDYRIAVNHYFPQAATRKI
jgi:TRAP-type mannitol/chloroaromatic compound transport system substrate-binding protein